VGVRGEGKVVPAWSADGQILLCPLTQLGGPELFALRLDDGQAARLSYTGGYAASAPFAGMSKETKVATQDTVLYVNEADGGTLWAVHVDGSGRQRIVPELDHITAVMRLSPDGGRLAGLRRAPGERVYTLWTLDLTTGSVYAGGTLGELPDLFHWAADGQTLYWVSQAALYRYNLGANEGQVVAQLPPPSPTPTPTPLPVSQRLIHYADGTFYQAEAYVGSEPLKNMPPSVAVVSGYSLHGGVVMFTRGADVYYLQLRGGVPTRLYTFQQERLVLVEATWSVQGNVLLYAATYEEEEGTTFGRRVDLGMIELKPSTREVVRVHRFTSLVDRSGAAPVLLDEERGQAIVVPWSGGRAFSRLDVYDVESGVEVGFLNVEGDGVAAVSEDWHWAAATGYDEAAARGFIRFYDLTTAEAISKTFLLPEGTFTNGPLRWSPEGEYVAFIPLLGDPGDRVERAVGIWVVRAETLEAVQVVSLEEPTAFLVGWSTEP